MVNHRRVWIGLLLMTLLFLGTILYQTSEPFASRYEGKTVDDWIKEVERRVTKEAQRNRAPNLIDEVPPPNANVINAFGESAVPALRKAAKSRQAWIIVRVRRAVPAKIGMILKSLEDRALRRCQIAQRWLQEILGPPPAQPHILPPIRQTNDVNSLAPAFV
jgi:hypothetical protein